MTAKYVRCCTYDNEGRVCNGDAVVDYAMTKPDGTRVYIPLCGKRSHLARGYRFKCKLEQGKAPEEIDDLNPKRLRYRHPGKKIITPAVPKVPAKKTTKGWHWVDDFDHWMNVEGQVVRIRDLEDHELLDAMHAIRRSNFTRYSKTIAWLKELFENDPPKYEFPGEELQVGRGEALAKLEQFREEAVERGMLNL